MRKIIAAILAATIPCMDAGAAFSKKDAGTATAQFLKLGAGARASGMGDAFTAMADDSTAVYWNPAGLSCLEGRSVSFMHAQWFEGINYEWFSYAQPVGKKYAAGLGIQYLSYGSITETDNTGVDTGNFSPSDISAALAFSRSLGNASMGISFKYISSQIEETATAFAADVGTQMNFFDSRLCAGIAAQNIGSGMKFRKKEEPLPFNIKTGAAYMIRNGWVAALDVNAPIDNDPYFSLGNEFTKQFDDNFTGMLRLGYNTISKDTGALNGITAGVGLGYRSYQLDYAFAPYGDLGNTHRISLSAKFGKCQDSEPAEKVQKKSPPNPAERKQRTPQTAKTVSTQAAPKPALRSAPLRSRAVVLPFAASGATEYDAYMLTNAIRSQLGSSERFTVVDAQTTENALKKMGLEKATVSRGAPAARVGETLGADSVVTGTIMFDDDIYVIKTDMTEVKTGQILNSAEKRTDSRTALKYLLNEISEELSSY